MAEQLRLEVVTDVAVAAEPLARRRSDPPAGGPQLGIASPRALGAYYTPGEAALYMAQWSLRAAGDRVLEPSMGDGIFLEAVRTVAAARGTAVELWGVELARDTYEATLKRGLVAAHRAIHGDFLGVKPFDADVLIGNPPYVRLRHLPTRESELALKVGEEVLRRPIDPSGSIWMPFVLHASRFLRDGGRLAFVLPYELTHVRYARPLWGFLSGRFGSIRIIRVFERVFPEILQDVVLLLADRKGERTDSARFEVYERSDDIRNERATVSEPLRIDDVVRGGRPFVEALLPAALRHVVREELAHRTVEAREAITFNIGYVTGDRGFFHPPADLINTYELPKQSLRPTIASGRTLRNLGIRTSNLQPSKRAHLFLPPGSASRLTDGERRYVRLGEVSGVNRRYKCRIRDPWFVTPGIRVPDVILPVFADRPVALINDARLLASNSLLCGFTRSWTAESFVAAWFTSLTLLELELRVHALGGGVMVLVPHEAGSVRIPRLNGIDAAHVSRLDALLRDGDADAAFEAGDHALRGGKDALDREVIQLVRDGVDTLRRWRARRSASGSSSTLASDVLVEVN